MASSAWRGPSRLLLVCLLLGLLFELANAGDRRRRPKKLKRKGKKKSNEAPREVKALKAELLAAKQDKSELRSRVKEFQHEASGQAKRISELMQQLSQQEQQISKLTTDLAGKQPAFDQSTKEILDKAKTTADLRQQMSVQQIQIANLTQKLSELRIAYEDVQEQYDDPTLQHFLAAKAQKVYHHPGIEGAANKTFTYVLPAVEGLLEERIGTLYNSTFSSIQEGLNSMVAGSDLNGDWIPTVSSFLVYGLYTVPLALALTCLVEFVCRVKYILLACSFYLFCISVGASAFVAYTREDPLNEFADTDANVYLWAQVGFGVVFLLYLLLMVVMCAISCLKPSSVLAEVISRTSQCVILFVFGIVYYQLVWTPAMVDETPKVETFMSKFSKQEDGEVGFNLMLAPYLISNVIFLAVFAIEEGIWHGLAEDKVAPEEKEEKGE